ncbi:MAG: shikimate kinase [Micrococcales bacterium]|nr:shikimate kinase [Micrococcales bacterium]
MVKPVAVLIGPPGAGKSTVGQIVAERLGVEFADTDHLVEQAERRSISDIFIEEGEKHFRDVERAVVTHALGAHAGVLALGGGAPMAPDVQRAMAGRTVVFLDVDIASAAPRIGLSQARPMLAVNPRGRWVVLMRERRATYEQLATHTVDTNNRAAAEVADEIVTLLGAGA